jgi:hypothetical protein
MTAPPRRRFYFSLRTLFVLMTILGLFLGWVGAQLKWIHDRTKRYDGSSITAHGSSPQRPGTWYYLV